MKRVKTVAVIYFIIGFIWLFVTSEVQAFFITNGAWFGVVSRLRDGLFVLVSALFIYYVVSAEINKNKRSLRRLYESEKKYRVLVSGSKDAVFFLDGEQLIYSNPKTLELFGCGKEQIGKLAFSDFLPPQPKDLKDSREKYHQYFQMAMKGKSQFFEWQFKRLDDVLFDAEVSLMRVNLHERTLLQVMVRDITQKKRVEQALRITEIKLHEIFDAIDDTILIIDPEQEKVIEANRAARERYGLVDAKPLDRAVSDFFPASLVARLPDLKAEIEARGFVALEAQTIDQKGQVIPVEVLARALHYNGRGFIISVGRDITERLQWRKKMFNAVMEAEEKERMRVARELHDGVSPIISAVKLYVQSMMDSDDENLRAAILQKAGETIDEAIVSLSEISNNLSPHVLQNFGLVVALESFIDRVKEMHAIKYRLDLKIEKRLPPIVEIALYRVIVELMNNSLKYARATEVVIKVNRINGVYLTYKDNGMGFDVDKAMAESKGMGLFNMTNRIQSLGGEITIDSARQKGCTVKAFLPLEE
ncbi:PAS domain S-box protein [Marinilabiliaceae bacterium JC017]|nr:PAS domain S-box protein [Marinilabiliaceae bacterium JC017]